MKKNKKILEDLQNIAKDNPESPLAWSNLGVLSFNMERFDE